MSAYTTLQTQLVSAYHLKRALESLGFPEVELHETPQPLIGFEGQDRNQTAEVIIRRHHLGAASNDIGFRRDGNGRFIAVIGDFDRQRFDTAWLMRLTQVYAYQVAREQLQQQGFELVEEEMDSRRTIRMTLRRVA